MYVPLHCGHTIQFGQSYVVVGIYQESLMDHVIARTHNK